jgi:hypothetical protein
MSLPYSRILREFRGFQGNLHWILLRIIQDGCDIAVGELQQLVDHTRLEILNPNITGSHNKKNHEIYEKQGKIQSFPHRRIEMMTCASFGSCFDWLVVFVFSLLVSVP